MIEKKLEGLYFIAIIPSETIYTEALQLKHYFKDQYNTKAALNSPPHITLHMPFQWKESKEGELIIILERFVSVQKPFGIKFQNFSVFEPRVIFINVIKDSKLESLQKQLKRFCKTELNLFNADYKELAYHPHLTLAFRDLKEQEFYKAWEEFRGKAFEANFIVNSVALLKHDGNEWKVFKQIPLKG